MMSKFIELHDNETKSPISINVNNIADYHVDYDGQTAVDVGRDAYLVAESYDEIKNLIKDAGVLIHKSDPRLDTTTPLTLEDLKNMIGEPVWNSNNNQWLIMAHYLDTKENPIAGLYNKNGYLVEFTADDLIRTPLYRMKQEGK